MSENGGRIVGFDGRYQRRAEPSPHACTGGMMATPIIPAEERFQKFVAPESANGCRLWIGPKSSGTGYGSFWMNGGNIGAHRAAYLLFVGPIPPGLFVLHSCDVRDCVALGHLFLGTNQDNCLDMARKARGTRTRGRMLPYGVSANHNRSNEPRPYRAQVRHQGKRIYLGVFPTAEEAGAVAAAFKQSLYGQVGGAA